MNKTFYAIVAGYNDYDQHGDYLISIFSEKPTFENFIKVCICYLDIKPERLNNYIECFEEGITNIERFKTYYEGKGRYKYEYCWFNLIEIEEGQIIKEK